VEGGILGLEVDDALAHGRWQRGVVPSPARWRKQTAHAEVVELLDAAIERASGDSGFQRPLGG